MEGMSDSGPLVRWQLVCPARRRGDEDACAKDLEAVTAPLDRPEPPDQQPTTELDSRCLAEASAAWYPPPSSSLQDSLFRPPRDLLALALRALHNAWPARAPALLPGPLLDIDPPPPPPSPLLPVSTHSPPLTASAMLVRMQRNSAGVLAVVAVLVLGALVHYLWQSEVALSAPWVPDAGAIRFADKPLAPPDPRMLIGEYALPLRTRGRDIVDARGRRFKLASVNWYGASDEHFVPGGLDVQHRDVIAQTIRRLGFNSVRLPYADEMVMANPAIPAARVAANPDLAGLPALDVFAAVVTALTEAGLAVIVNNHITAATWCCGADPCDAGWANDHLPVQLCRVRQSEDEWIAHWQTVMRRFVDNPRVIGADLRNEVRGLWGTMPWARWATAAERCGNALLRLDPRWLVIVGGTESGNDLTGVAARPVILDVPHRVVYSAHVYSWSGWGSREGRFAQRSYASFVRAMRRSWAYLVEEDRAPVWIGEFGAPHEPSVGDANYWKHLLRFLAALDADFGYWAINPRKPAANAVETYALVADDWRTPVLDYRMRDLSELMRLHQ